MMRTLFPDYTPYRDLKKKEKTRSFQGHRAAVTSVVFGKSDARVASASVCGDILVHSVVTGTTGNDVRTHTQSALTLCSRYEDLQNWSQIWEKLMP